MLLFYTLDVAMTFFTYTQEKRTCIFSRACTKTIISLLCAVWTLNYSTPCQINWRRNDANLHLY